MAEDPDEILADWVAANQELGKQQRRAALRRVEDAGMAAVLAVSPTYTDEGGFVFERSGAMPLGKIRLFDEHTEHARILVTCLCANHHGCNFFLRIRDIRNSKALEEWLAIGRSQKDERAHLDLIPRMVLIAQV